MNKLNNTLLTMAIGIIGLPGQSLSDEITDKGLDLSGSYLARVNAGHENEKHSFYEINTYINELVGSHSQTNELKSKSNRQDVENLAGKWTLSYKYLGLSYTDKMAINEVVFNDGEYAIVGNLNTQQHSAGHQIACLTQPQELVDILRTDYACVSIVNGNYLMYSFKYSGNKITKGLYGFGSTIESVAEDLVFNKTSLTGHRESEAQNTALNTVSGLWYDPELSGLGFNFIDAEIGLTGYYYGYDHNGSTLWLNASNSIKGNIVIGKTYTLNMNQPTVGNGANFNTRPTSAASGTETWGTLELTFNSCSAGIAVLTGDDGTQSFNLVKLAGNKGGVCN